MSIKRRSGGAAAHTWPDDREAWVNLVPDLVNFLGDVAFDDGSPRITGTMTISVEAGQLKAKLADRDECLSCWLTAVDAQSLLLAADAACRGEAGEWRADKWLVAQRRRIVSVKNG